MAAAVIVYLILHLVAVFANTQYLWGVDSWSFLPTAWTFAFLALGFFSVIPQTRNASAKVFSSIGSALGKIPLWVWGLPLAGLFYLFAQEGFFLGDGRLRLTNLEKGLVFSPAEPLDTMLHAWVFKAFGGELPARDVFLHIGAIFGLGAFVGAATYFEKSFEKKSAAFLLFSIFTSGAVLLFFGYVESYSILAAFVILFLASSVFALHKERYRIEPAIFGAAACASHFAGWLLLPAGIYLYVILIKNTSENDKPILKIFAPIAVFIVLVGAVGSAFAFGDFDLNRFMSLVSGERFTLPVAGQYGMLSPAHLADIANEYLLVVPAIVAVPILLAQRKRIAFDSTGVFLSIGSVAAFLFAFVVNPVLGYSRDWDLFAFAAFPTTALICYLIVKNKRANLSAFALPIVLVSIIHTAPWAYINSKTNLAEKRAERIASTPRRSPRSKAALRDVLSHYYYDEAEYAKAAESIEIALENQDNDRYVMMAAASYHAAGNIDKAIIYYEEMINRDFRKADALTTLGQIRYDRGEIARAIKSYEEVLQSRPKDPTALVNLAIINKELQNWRAAEKYFRLYAESNPQNTGAKSSLGEVLYNLGEYDQAIEIYENLIESDPGNPNTYFNLALCLFGAGDYDKALENVERAREMGFDPNILNQLQAEIDKAR